MNLATFVDFPFTTIKLNRTRSLSLLTKNIIVENAINIAYSIIKHLAISAKTIDSRREYFVRYYAFTLDILNYSSTILRARVIVCTIYAGESIHRDTIDQTIRIAIIVYKAGVINFSLACAIFAKVIPLARSIIISLESISL